MFVKITNGVPEKYTLGLLRRENPNVSFPKEIPEATLQEYGVYPLQDTPQTNYDSLTQNISETFTQSNGVWFRTWQVESKPAEEIVLNLQSKIASDRYEKETSGIVWTDASGDTWFLDTSLDSQARLTGVASAVSSGLRVDGSVWKCAQVIDAETYNLAYRPTTNAEIEEWANLVHQHVQKCFTAESNAVAKVMVGDYTSSFEQEFLAL